MKKLIVSLGIVFLYSNLFAAAAAEDIRGTRRPQSASHTPTGPLPQATNRLTGLPPEVINKIFNYLDSDAQSNFLCVNREASQTLPTALTLDMKKARESEILEMVEFLKSRQYIERLEIKNIKKSG